MASTRKGYLMVGRQSGGSAVAVKPTHPVRFKDGDPQYKQENIPNNPIQNQRWNALNSVKGKANTDGSWNFDLDPIEAPFFLSAALGNMSSEDISSETDASVYKHTMTVADSLPCLTIEQGKGNLTDTGSNRQGFNVARAYGVMVDQLTIAGSDGIINMEVATKAHGVFQMTPLMADVASGSSKVLPLKSIEGLVAVSDSLVISDRTPQNEVKAIASLSVANKTVTIATLANSYTVANKAKVALAPQTPAYTIAARVLAFDNASFYFGEDLTEAATATEENVEDWEFSFMNNLEERFGSLRKSPSVIAPKGAKATFKYKKYFETIIDLERYLNNERQACIVKISDDEVVSATDTGLNRYSIILKMSDVKFTAHEMPTGTDELYAAEVEAELYYDATDGAALTIEVINDQAGSVYTSA